MGLLIAPVALIAGCTSPAARSASPAAPSASPAPSAKATGQGTPVLAARPCRKPQLRRAVRRFFTTWDHRDHAAFGRLFGPDGVLDMATKRQDTRHTQAWTDSAGRAAIVAFAIRQWHLGEVLAYKSMTIYINGYGLGGAEANQVTARFADGSTQPIEEAKFNYACAARAFTHVVIISAGAASKP